MNRLIAIVGPTASGKTRLAVELAERIGGSILNVDSMQVYRGLDVGTAKPTEDERARVPFYGVDIVDPTEVFDAAAFAEYARDAVATIRAAGRIPIACGGTGLYHRAFRFGLDPVPERDDAVRAHLKARREAEGQAALHAELARRDPEVAAKIHPNDWVRIERALEVLELTGESIAAQHRGYGESLYETLVLGCFRPREALYARINGRLDAMWQGGLMDEARSVQALSDGSPVVRALGYRQALSCLSGEMNEALALRKAKTATRRFAKRQLTWFRADPATVWLEMPLDNGAMEQLAQAALAFDRGEAFSDRGLPRVDSV